MNLFIYPYAPAPVQDSIEGFRGTTPFGGDGIARHFSVVSDPEKADLFWMGQYADGKVWLLHPNRFPHFERWPERHVVDLEGDWRDSPFPEWLRSALVITSNWNTDRHGDWERVFTRVIMSPLLMRLVRDPPPFEPPKERKFWFHGQRDPLGVREKVKTALETSGLPHDFRFNDEWLCYVGDGDARLASYVQAMRENAFALCVRGSGQNTCRFYEAAAFGRIPIIVSNHYGFGEPEFVTFRINETRSAAEMIVILKAMYNAAVEEAKWANDACEDIYQRYFIERMLPYFRDPTAYFLKWAASKNLINL